MHTTYRLKSRYQAAAVGSAMIIERQSDLKTKLFSWSTDDPIMTLNESNLKYVFANNGSAKGVYFLGHSPNGTHDNFELRYVGKAVKQPLFDRLLQHVRTSHNPEIRRHLAAASRDKGDPVYFRFAECASIELAEQAEGVLIAAFLWKFEKGKLSFSGWNRRNEWAQHWAGE